MVNTHRDSSSSLYTVTFTVRDLSRVKWVGDTSLVNQGSRTMLSVDMSVELSSWIGC